MGFVKHQQLASGASLLAYWIANFTWDYSMATIQTLVFTFALYCARADSFDDGDFMLIFGIGLLFNLCAIFRFYLFSNFVGDIRMAQTFYFYGSLLSQFTLTSFYVLIVYTALNGDASSSTARIISVICTCIDPAFGYIFILLLQNDFLGVRTQNDDDPVTSNSVAGGVLAAIGITSIFYILAVVVVEVGPLSIIQSARLYFCGIISNTRGRNAHANSGLGEDLMTEEVLSVDDSEMSMNTKIVDAKPNPRSTTGMDPDVQQEKQLVQAVMTEGKLNTSQHAIFISKLSKIFYGRGSQPTKVAVKDMSLSISRGEIFGLYVLLTNIVTLCNALCRLGANGAGKTTLLRMVSGLELPTGGIALINGFDVVNSRSLAQRSMGLWYDL